MTDALNQVDWSKLPPPHDDGAARHLAGSRLPPVVLPASDGRMVDLAALEGRGIIYVYPMASRPDLALPAGWDDIPGARGCSPQSCAFRDHFADLREVGVQFLFGLSTQTVDEHRETIERLHLPFPLLSDAGLGLARALNLPTFEAGGRTLLKRMTFVLLGPKIEHVFYPVFPPDRNAEDVVAWLRRHPA